MPHHCRPPTADRQLPTANYHMGFVPMGEKRGTKLAAGSFACKSQLVGSQRLTKSRGSRSSRVLSPMNRLPHWATIEYRKASYSKRLTRIGFVPTGTIGVLSRRGVRNRDLAARDQQFHSFNIVLVHTLHSSDAHGSCGDLKRSAADAP